MCIRDRNTAHAIARGLRATSVASAARERRLPRIGQAEGGGGVPAETCLLYTSDAADERSSVDLGGRRLIKKTKRKKKKKEHTGGESDTTNDNHETDEYTRTSMHDSPQRAPDTHDRR